MSYHDEVIRDNPSAYWSFQDAPAGKGTRVNLCPDPSFEGSNPISQYWQFDIAPGGTLAKNTGTTNLFTPMQTSFVGGTTGWVTDGTSAITSDTAQWLFGGQSMRVDIGVTNAWGAKTTVVPISASTTYTTVASFRNGVGSRTQYRVTLSWYNGGTPLSTTSGNAATPGSGWDTSVATGVSPSNATHVQIIVSPVQTGSISDTFYVDNVGLWQGAGGVVVPGGQASPFSYNGNNSMSVLCTVPGAFQISQKVGTLAEFTPAPGKTYTVSAKALGTVANATTKIGIIWRTATGATSTALSSAISTNVTSWTTLSYSGVAPEDAIGGRVVITSTMALNEIMYLDAFLVEQGTTVRGYFDGDTIDATWLTDKSGISVFGVSRTNCVKDPRFVNMSNTSLWYTPNYAHRQISSGGHDERSYIEGTVTNAGLQHCYGVAGITSNYMPVRAGEEIVVSVYVKNLKTANDYLAYLLMYDKNGDWIQNPGTGLGTVEIIGEWKRQAAKFVVPLNCVYARIGNIVFPEPKNLGDIVSGSGLMLESGDTLNEYFDGSYDDCAWTGTANQSFSVCSTVNDETFYNNTALANTGWSKFPQASEEYNSAELTTGSEIVYTDYYPTNLLTDNQASMETSVVTTGASGCTVSQSSTYAYSGTYSGKMVSSGSGQMLTGTLAEVNVTAGETYTYSGYVMSDKPGGMGVFVYGWFPGSQMSDQPDDNYRVNATINGWTRFERTVVVPGDATTMRLQVGTSALLGGHPTAAGQALYFDGLCVSKGVSGRWKLPSNSTPVPANRTAFPVRALSGIADQKPFVFECLFKPDSYKSTVALLETYVRPDNIALLGQSGITGGTSISVPSDAGIFAGRLLTGGNNLGIGTAVTNWDSKSFTITNASYTGGVITITAPGHTLIAGNSVTILGVNPVAYNIQGAVATINGDTFTINMTISGGTYVSGGEVKTTIVNLTVANLASIAGYVTSTSVNGSGFYYSDGQIYFRAYGVDRFNNAVDSRVEYNLPDTNSHHLVFRVAGNQASIYVDGKLVASDKFTLPAKYDSISGYRSKAYVGSGWLSNVALYNSSINIDEITAHYTEKVGTKDNLATYAGTTKQVFDINSKNNQSMDTLSSPSTTPWSGYDRTNVTLNEKANRMGLQTFNPVVPYNQTVTYTADGIALKSNGLYFEDAQSVTSGDFAITGSIRFNQYTQDADSYDGQRFCIFQVSSEDKSSTISAYRILQDVSGTKYNYLVLGVRLTGQEETLEYIDYSPYGTSFPTTEFDIMLKRYGDTITLVAYNTVTGSTGTATIINSAAASIVGPLYVGMTNDNASFGQFTINTLKIADTITDDATFMTSMLTQERCYAKLLTNLKVSQRGYATNSIVPSSTNSDGTTNTTVNDMRVLWEPENSNIKVSTKVNRNLLSIDEASLENSIIGWSAWGGTCSLARNTTQSLVGSASLAVTDIAGGNGNGYDMFYLTSYGATVYPATAGETFTAVASFKAATTSRQFRVEINFRGSSPTTSFGTYVSDNTTGWTQGYCTATAPAGTTSVDVTIRIASAVNNEVHYGDCFGLWRGTDTFWAAPYCPDGVNLLSINQSSVETDTSGFTSIQASIARSTAKSLMGSASLAVTSTTTGSIQAYTSLGSAGITVEPGRQYTGVASVLAATTPRSMFVGIWWYDSGGGFVGSHGSASVTTSTTEWKTLSANGIAPANAVWGAVGAVFYNAAGAGEVHYVDRWGLMPGANQPWSAPITDGTVWQPITESGGRPSWFVNNGSVPYKNDIRIDFATDDSLDDVPELYSLSAAYDTLGAIEEIKSGEDLDVSGQYTLAESNLPVTAQAKNGGFKQIGPSSIYYQPDITRDNIIPNWSFTSYAGWDSNEDETIVVDKTLSSGVGMAIPMSSTASLFTSSDTKYNVVSSAQYTLCVYAKATGDAAAVATIHWYDATGASVGSPTSSSSTPLDTSIVTTTVTATAPATAKTATVSIAFTGTDEQTVTIDSVVMNEGAATITIDDNSPFVIFPQAHTYKTVAMVIRSDSEFYTSNSTTLFDHYNGSVRYRINMTSGGVLSYTGFSRVYVNGSQHFTGNAIVSDGWTHIVATIDDAGSINPSSSRTANFLSTTTSTEYGYWSADSLWFQRDVATQASVTNDYQEIFGRINKKVYDVLSATTILGSEEYRTISTPWTQVSSPQ